MITEVAYDERTGEPEYKTKEYEQGDAFWLHGKGY